MHPATPHRTDKVIWHHIVSNMVEIPAKDGLLEGPGSVEVLSFLCTATRVVRLLRQVPGSASR